MASEYSAWVAEIHSIEDAMGRALTARNHHADARKWLERRIRRGEIRDLEDARQALADMDEAQVVIEDHLTLLRTLRAQLSTSRHTYG